MMKATREELLALLQLVDITRSQEIDCDEFLARVAGFIERLGPKGSLPKGYEEVVHHLRVCPECLEEYEALYEAWWAEQDARQEPGQPQ